MPRSILLVFLLVSFPLLAAPGDVPLSPTLQAPLTGIHDVAVATSGDEFLIAFGRLGGIYVQRVALDGAPIDRRAIHIDWETYGYPVRVAWNGTSYLVVWVKGEVLVGQHIGRDGTIFPRFQIVNQAPYFDAIDLLAGDGDTAVLSKGEQTWLHIIDAEGTVVRKWRITERGAGVARIQRAWRVLVHPSTSGLHLLDPETGATTMLWPSFWPNQVYASPAGGALVATGGREFAVVTPQGEFKKISLEGPIDVDLRGPIADASPAPEGWALFYRSSNRERLATVLSNGTVTSDREIAGVIPFGSDFSPMAGAGTTLQRHLLIRASWPGLDSVLVLGDIAVQTPAYAIGDAAQHSATIARGPGIDLVVWNEAVEGGWALRATRVAGDRPLDGEGLLLSSGANPAEAVFDGEHFVVVWDQVDGTFLRRIGIDGRPVDPTPILLDPDGGVSTIASLGGGEVLIGWQFGGRIAMVREGATVSRMDLFPEPRQLYILEATPLDDSFLILTAPLIPGCQITCAPEPVTIEAHRLARDGSRIGAPINVGTTTDPGSIGTPTAAGGALFFTWIGSKGPEVVRVGASAPLISRAPALQGALRSTPAGIEIVGSFGSSFRGMLGLDLEPLWYEPLPVTTGERVVGVLTSETSFLVESNQRYFLRRTGAGGEADLAIVYRGRRDEPFTVIHDVTIEHRGGDPVNTVFLHVWGKPYVTLSASRPIVSGRIEGPFLPGESIDVSISGGSSGLSTRLLVALPDARDGVAANNFLEIAPQGPVRERRRAVAR